jgi:serine/threonine protein kinase
LIGTVLGNRYELLSEIGSGGMARVYKAKDRYLQRTVAIKILKDEFREDSEFLKRFDTEAQAAASLAHPNIIQIYDVGRDNNRYYIVMEYVDGITLKEYILKRGALDWREVVNLSIQICSALSKAHSRNIIHRDIKPNNIIMTSEGMPKIADFGIAHSVSNDTATMKVDTVGSVHYSSPEQVRGGYTDEQSDIYSIGITIYEMVTGRLPFDGETPVAVALMHIHDDPPVPSSIKSDIPKALDYIILKAMAKSRQDRYATVADLISDLENLRINPEASNEILLPNIKREVDKFSTKKFETLGDEDLKNNESTKKSPKASGSGNKGRKYLMPLLYITLIVAIVGGITYFVSTILGEMFRDTEELPKEVMIGSYTGRDINEVIKELELEGIKPVLKFQYDDKVAKDIIIKQDPPLGTKIVIGGLTNLELIVSKGVEKVEIPNIKNMDHNAARFKLQDELGLEVIEKSEHNEEVPTNLVIRCDPEIGTEVEKGSVVTIYWSLGPEKEQVVVPNLIGKTYEQAVRLLNESKLKLGDTFPEGREGYQGEIVDQIPKPGDTVLEDTPINIYFKEETTGTGDDSPDPEGISQTIIVNLPLGHNFGDSVRLRAYMINIGTGDESKIFDYENVPTSNFPHPVLINIPSSGGVAIKIYVNDILVKEQVF